LGQGIMFIKNLNPLRIWGRGGDTRTHLGWGLGSIIHPRRGTGRGTGLYQGIGFGDGVGKNRPRSAPLPCLITPTIDKNILYNYYYHSFSNTICSKIFYNLIINA